MIDWILDAFLMEITVLTKALLWSAMLKLPKLKTKIG